MRTFSLTTMIALFLLLYSNCIMAQIAVQSEKLMDALKAKDFNNALIKTYILPIK